MFFPPASWPLREQEDHIQAEKIPHTTYLSFYHFLEDVSFSSILI